MKKIIIPIMVLIILSLNSLAQENSYVIELQNLNNELILTSIELVEGPGADYLDQPETGYLAKALSFKNEEILSYKFKIIEELIIENPSDSNITALAFKGFNPNEEPIFLNFPYYPNAKKIEILDENGELKLDIDLSSYARCNENDFCDFNENLITCPEDCRKEVVGVKPQEQQKEEVKEVIPAASEETIKEKILLNQLEEQGISKNLLIIIAVLAIILILIIILSRKKK